jgi:mRNA interferase YafQ
VLLTLQPYSRSQASELVLTPVFSIKFKRDIKHAGKRGKDMAKLKTAIELLVEQVPLPAEYRDHPLRGNWKD